MTDEITELKEEVAFYITLIKNHIDTIERLLEEEDER